MLRWMALQTFWRRLLCPCPAALSSSNFLSHSLKCSPSSNSFLYPSLLSAPSLSVDPVWLGHSLSLVVSGTSSLGFADSSRKIHCPSVSCWRDTVSKTDRQANYRERWLERQKPGQGGSTEEGLWLAWQTELYPRTTARPHPAQYLT